MSTPKVNEAVRKQVRQFFNQLTLIFIGFIGSIFLFLLSVLIGAQSADPKSHDLDTVLFISAPLSSMALILISHRLFLARAKSAREAQKLYEKMDAYRGATVVRFLLLDGAAFVQLIAFFLTENRIFLPIALVVATLFMLYRPGLERFIKDMELNEVEAQVIRDHSQRALVP
ncbi:MAG: hypothetical protein IPN95_09885 [Bacteroidetes bacterium]|nr:hypothetical protein [Bacteroidota bacterium]